MRALGFTLSQVVHDYGDICQAITEIAGERHLPITTEEFCTLNRCLETAIAEAVTEHARITAESTSTDEIERSAKLAHEVRDIVNTAVLAFHTLKRGTVPINGSTGTVLSRSLASLREVVDNTLSDIRMAARIQRNERVALAAFLNDIGLVAHLQAEASGTEFVIGEVDAGLAVNGDPGLLESAVMNLLNNAFKFTRAGGRVVLRALREGQRVHIEVEDECGGISDGTADPFEAFAVQHAADGTIPGVGLSIARKAVRAHGGDVYHRNLPGKGCVFAIDVPLAPEGAPVPHRTR
jgi:signal transduction histidine kinase